MKRLIVPAIGLAIIAIPVVRYFRSRKFKDYLLNRAIFNCMTAPALMLLISCTPVVLYRSVPVVIVPVMIVPDLKDGGRMSCDTLYNQPLISIRGNEVDGPHLGEILKHEVIHVVQSYRERSCYAFLVRYSNDPDFQFDTEAEAYCRTVGYIEHSREVMHRRHGSHLTREESDLKLRSICEVYHAPYSRSQQVPIAQQPP